MKFVNRLKQATIGTSTASLSLGAVIGVGFRTLAQCRTAPNGPAIGDTLALVVDDLAGNWLEGEFQIVSDTQLTRVNIFDSSTGGSDVTLSGNGVLICAPNAQFLNGYTVAQLPSATPDSASVIEGSNDGGVTNVRFTLNDIAAAVKSINGGSTPTAAILAGAAVATASCVGSLYSTPTAAILAGAALATPVATGALTATSATPISAYTMTPYQSSTMANPFDASGVAVYSNIKFVDKNAQFTGSYSSYFNVKKTSDGSSSTNASTGWSLKGTASNPGNLTLDGREPADGSNSNINGAASYNSYVPMGSGPNFYHNAILWIPAGFVGTATLWFKGDDGIGKQYLTVTISGA